MKRVVVSGIAGCTGLFGIFTAASAGSGPTYWLGLALFLVCFLGVIWLVKQHFDGADDRVMPSLLPETSKGFATLAVVSGLTGLIGLFIAASGDRELYWIGLALFLTCALLTFRAIKGVFDIHDRDAAAGH